MVDCRIILDVVQLKTVAAAGGNAILLVNSDDSVLMLGAVNFEAIDAVGVSIPKSQGEQLRALTNANALELRLEIAAKHSAIEQATERIQYFTDVNAPVAAFESYWDAVHSLSLPALEELVQAITANTPIDKSDAFAFFLATSNLLSRWDFAEKAALHAFTGAAALLPLTINKRTDFNVARTLEAEAHRLIAAGYYAAGRVLLDRRLTYAVKRKANTKESETSCQIAVTRFLEADLMGSIGSISSMCAEFENKLSATVRSVQVAEQMLHRFSALEVTESDRVCLMKAAGELGEENDNHCCYHETTKKGKVLRFNTRIVSELYQALNVMGVFTDELGAFNASLRFFEQADRLCDDGPSLKVRLAGNHPWPG